MSTVEEEMFEKVELVNDNILQPIPPDKQKPTISSPQWTDYILSLLTDDEKVINKKTGQSFPKTEGLRRISNLVLGKVLVSEAIEGPVIYTEKGLVVVAKHRLVIDRYDGQGVLEVVGLSDAREEFLDPPFHKYVSSNASTKSLGRAYRDALQLKVCVAEEVNNIKDLIGSSEPEDAIPASDAQRKAIETMCKKMKIDCQKFIKLGSFPHKSIDDVLAGTAKKMISVLNGFQNGTEIPPEILRES